MRIVVAVGGNALLQRGQPMSIGVLKENVRLATSSLAQIAKQHQLVITHGNGPQIGLLALQSLAYSDVDPYPLDVLGAESQGLIGYLIAQSVINKMPDKKCVTLLTQIEVDINDPAFSKPTKFIGPIYSQAEAEFFAEKYHWKIARDGGYFRRVVASPRPRSIIEIEIIVELLAAGVVVICGGGGGIPVIKKSALEGVEAVIDKDFTSSLLAEKINSDSLLLLTDVEAVMLGWGTRSPKPIRIIKAHKLRKLSFSAGSMGPKVLAACDFVEKTGKFAYIGGLENSYKVLLGISGTKIIP